MIIIETAGRSSDPTLFSFLFFGDDEVGPANPEEGLDAFIKWLGSLGGDVILVAHKCLDFDAKVLLRNLKEFGIKYSDTILGFSGSLLASRQLYNQAISLWLSAILYEVRLPVRESHDAMEDAEDCRRICQRTAAQCGFRRQFTGITTIPYGYVTVIRNCLAINETSKIESSQIQNLIFVRIKNPYMYTRTNYFYNWL